MRLTNKEILLSLYPHISYMIIILGVLSGVLYPVLRVYLIEHYVWILFMPLLSLPFLFLRLTRGRYDKLDILVLFYIVNGIILALIAWIWLSYSGHFIGSAILHYYFPILLYFPTRYYIQQFHRSPLTLIVWTIAIILIIDIIVEDTRTPTLTPILSADLSYLSEPRAQDACKDPRVASHSPNTLINLRATLTSRFQGILDGGSKATGMMSIAIFAFLLPLSLRSTNWQSLIIILGLLTVALIAGNKVSLIAAGLIILVNIITAPSSLLRRAIVIVGLLAVIMLFSNRIEGYIVQSTGTIYAEQPKGESYVGYTVDIEGVTAGYKDVVIDSYNKFSIILLLLGTYSIPCDQRGMGLVETTFSSEFRLALYPLTFGLIWTLIVLAIIFVVIKQLINLSKFDLTLALAIGGLLFVYVTDFHYVSIMNHGQLELLVVVIASLAGTGDREKSCY